MERYQVKIDMASGIGNGPNDWLGEDLRQILDLLARVITDSVETVGIVKALPPLSMRDGGWGRMWHQTHRHAALSLGWQRTGA